MVLIFVTLKDTFGCQSSSQKAWFSPSDVISTMYDSRAVPESYQLSLLNLFPNIESQKALLYILSIRIYNLKEFLFISMNIMRLLISESHFKQFSLPKLDVFLLTLKRRHIYTFLRNKIDYKQELDSIKTMKKMLVQSIKELKREKQMGKSAKKNNQSGKKHQDSKNSPKRSAPSYSYPHRQKKSQEKGLFAGYSFCFPLVDEVVTKSEIQILTQSIGIEGGSVTQFNEKAKKRHDVDFLLINPKTQPQDVAAIVEGRLTFKEILDYNFIVDSLTDGKLKDVEKYSLFINIGELWSGGEKSERKKQKRQSDNVTEKLSDDDGDGQLDKGDVINKGKNEIVKGESDDEDQYIRNYERENIAEKLINLGGGEHEFSINKYIAEELTKLMKIYATERDLGRKLAYMKAATAIKNLDKEIETQKDVENIKGIGKKIADKIKELLETGKISKLEKLQGSEKNVILGQFCKVWGIGPSKAQELYSLGLRSLDDLRKRTDLLSKNQKIGLKYHQELQTKIPRQKVTKMFQFIKNVIATLVPSLDMYRIEVCGSYRRGKATCGDMDIIISRKDGTYEKHLLPNIVKQLENQRFLTDHLTTPKPSDSRSSVSYMGICQFQGPEHHRIDIKYYPIEQYAYAILYFTGSGAFNRMMRLHCMKEGLNLSDHGAAPKMQKGVIWTKPIPKCLTEEDIFKFLGFEYKTPQQRDM